MNRKEAQQTTNTELVRLLYSRKEAAYMLSISARSLDYLIEDGRIQVRRIGSRVLVAHEELRKAASRDMPYTLVKAA